MKTRKILSVLLTLAMALGLLAFLPITASADGVDITADFTDANFKAEVYKLVGKTAPAPIYDTDAAKIGNINVSSKNIKSLAGLEHFTELRRLDCGSNQLTSLPALPSSLHSLDCYSNQLTSLPALPSNLDMLLCGGNQLTSLPALPSSLRVLNCGGNQLTSLPALPSFLTDLYCDSNQLTLLPALPSSLEGLFCYSNQLTSLPALPPSLEILYCANNRLSSLPKLPAALKSLDCIENQLTTIDVTGLSLDMLRCFSNNMPNKSAVIGFTGKWNGTSHAFALQNSTSFFAKLWDFILMWILFGWIWYK